MATLTEFAQKRSRMFQLQALGFTHPVKEFHDLLADNSYAQALAESCAKITADSCQLPSLQAGFAGFEADYIHIFQMGRGGKPIIALTAGDHKSLNNEQGRPEFMLVYTGWYKHFGLKINEDPNANELPDHLVCQLEFMAWLSHLENSARDDETLVRGYQNAQRDFLLRHLQPFLALLTAELQNAAERPRGSTFHLALATLTLETTNTLLQQLDATLEGGGEANTTNETDQIAAVNLWG